MDMRGERILPADRATVWSLLNDPEILRQCVPGCESLVATAEHSYDVAMTAAVGPVRARFKGKLSLADIEAPLRYRLLFDGQSSQAGFARGEATVELLELAADQTKLSYTAKSQIGGKLAQIGGRLIDAAAAATADKFFEAFAGKLPAPAVPPADRPAAAAAAEPRRAGFAGWVLAFLRHLFGRKA
ncbi:MAG TPA: carbon monoxide dehydrogenase subunit G [Steroidobacteraceae bacterium]|nr:carbon monoxide dehydrogenase subunit G [Steroidobacteraceae bacterium]